MTIDMEMHGFSCRGPGLVESEHRFCEPVRLPSQWAGQGLRSVDGE